MILQSVCAIIAIIFLISFIYDYQFSLTPLVQWITPEENKIYPLHVLQIECNYRHRPKHIGRGIGGYAVWKNISPYYEIRIDDTKQEVKVPYKHFPSLKYSILVHLSENAVNDLREVINTHQFISIERISAPSVYTLSCTSDSSLFNQIVLTAIISSLHRKYKMGNPELNLRNLVDQIFEEKDLIGSLTKKITFTDERELEKLLQDFQF